MSKKWGLALVLALVLGFVLGRVMSPKEAGKDNLAKKTPQASSEVVPVLAVEVVRPTIQNAFDTVSADGVIAGRELAYVGTKVSGVAIEQVLVREGDTVKKGQVLALLDSTQLAGDVAQVRAALEEAQAAYAQAQNDLQRTTPLVEIDAISKQQYEGYQTTYAQAEARLKSAQARLHNVFNQAQNTKVVAPVSGIIAKKNAKVGMMTSGGVLFEIIENGELEWQAKLLPTQVGQVQVGQMASIGKGDKAVLAQVVRLAPVADDGRQMLVHAALQDSKGLYAGMYVSGKFLIDERSVPMLPKNTITQSDGKAYVWVIKDQKAYRKQVVLGQEKGTQVEVDLPADSAVVKQGGNFLYDGAVVKVVSNTSSSSSQDQASTTQATTSQASTNQEVRP